MNASVYIVSSFIVMAVSAWAAVSQRVDVGLFTRLILCLLSITALSVAACAWQGSLTASRPQWLFMLAAACLGLRFFYKTAVKPKITAYHEWRSRCS